MHTTFVFDSAGWCQPATRIASPNQDDRPGNELPSLLVIHNISLPPKQYGGPGVIELFTNQLDANEHPYYAGICHLRVSAHFLIRRTGELIQFVPVLKRAWHAGVSQWQGRERCNDFSIGIELEGTDDEVFTAAQYAVLHDLATALRTFLPSLTAVTGHSDIAPGRKTDPGPCFDWTRLVGPTHPFSQEPS
ncbi:1,6-anhydro-N-acetylmuramyl-L-alanine amidase AmpD [Leeia oryzae]|uniref:1,6-anhydro-N-acetylmuramyl-L-alanine amidase AmpD n=1 Tax=Leeia oryzae TaxID=356662 RepID=UPI00037769F2|nr:1,6-anhydro-N-acetylmuramyl-L-alanine amidase AmpD [Leeia oryzae]